MTKSMAEVLAEHVYHNTEVVGGIRGRWSIECNCDEIVTADSHADAEAAFVAHQAAALAAAGFGLVADAKAEAWDEGIARGGELAAWAIGNRPYSERPDTTNPYREARRDDQ